MELNKIVLERAVEVDGKKKLSCKTAHDIAEEHTVSLQDIGQICDDNKIKITACELGCF